MKFSSGLETETCYGREKLVTSVYTESSRSGKFSSQDSFEPKRCEQETFLLWGSTRRIKVHVQDFLWWRSELYDTQTYYKKEVVNRAHPWKKTWVVEKKHQTLVKFLVLWCFIDLWSCSDLKNRSFLQINMCIRVNLQFPVKWKKNELSSGVLASAITVKCVRAAKGKTPELCTYQEMFKLNTLVTCVLARYVNNVSFIDETIEYHRIEGYEFCCRLNRFNKRKNV